MQMRMLLDRKSPKILRNMKTLHNTSPAVHITVAAQPISSGIIRKVTCEKKNTFSFPITIKIKKQ